MPIDKYNPYLDLAASIVIHNIKRYISAANHYRKYQDTNDLYEMDELKRWFYSDRFKLYCSIHPDRIMEHIKKELSNETKSKDDSCT